MTRVRPNNLGFDILEMPLKKQQQIKNQAVETRVFTLKDLLGELSDRGISVHKITELPDSNLAIPGISL